MARMKAAWYHRLDIVCKVRCGERRGGWMR